MSQLRSSPTTACQARGRSPEPFKAASQDLQKKMKSDADAAIDRKEVKELLVAQGQVLESAKLEFADQDDVVASDQTEMQELLRNLCGQYFLARKDLDPTANRRRHGKRRLGAARQG